MKISYNVECQARDGLTLRSDIYFPDGEGPWPAILVRTPYDKSEYIKTKRYTLPEFYTNAGYAVIFQDCRGTGVSEGQYQPWLMDAEDGYDTVEWLAKEPWCTGRIGMMGSSNLGATQLLAASMRPPHLRCIAPAGTSANFPFFKDGVLDLAGTSIWYMQQAVKTSRRAGLSGEKWERLKRRMQELSEKVEDQFGCLPLKDIPFAHVDEVQMDRFFLEYLDHIEDVGYWSKLHMPVDVTAIEIPTLWIVNWYDHLAKNVLEGYHKMKHSCVPAARNNLYLYFGPWRIYTGVKGSDRDDCLPGDDSGQPLWGGAGGERLSDILRGWFDTWLKDLPGKFDRENHVRVHTVGAEARWRYEKTWPIPKTRFVPCYLSSECGANSRSGDGVLTEQCPKDQKPDQYEYDPLDPAPSRSGLVINPKDSLIQDQSEVEDRKDVLVYTMEPFSQMTEVTGPVSVRLWASTDGPDTDFTAKCVKVGRNHVPVNLAEGIVRARFRRGWDKPELLLAGAIYEYEINLGAIGCVFAPGEALRLEISSSNFPKWDRNLNTGNPIGQDAETRKARQTIYHDALHPSHILLPVIE